MLSGLSVLSATLVYCGQTAGWIKMKLGTEVSLGPGHTARWGPSSPTQKGAQNPKFSAHVCCDQTAGWIGMPLSMEVGLGPGHLLLDGDPVLPQRRSTAPQYLVHVL